MTEKQFAREGDDSVSLTRYERETIINFNDGEDEATVYTCNKVLLRKLEALCVKYPSVYRVVRENENSKVFALPKKLISVRSVRGLTPEQKQNFHRRGKELAKLSAAVEK